jgi:cytochrome b
MDQQHQTRATVRAWDPLIRIFHWSLVFFFFLAYITEDDWLAIHTQAGYAVLMLIAFRLFWGFFGPERARFFNFIKSPATVISHLKGMLSFKVTHYLGHNPVAAVMVVALLTSIVLVSITGLATLASEGQGPLANTFFASWRSDWMEEVHEFFANFTLFLVFAHVAGVFVSSLLEGENLARAMITGRKKSRDHWQDVKQPETTHE